MWTFDPKNTQADGTWSSVSFHQKGKDWLDRQPQLSLTTVLRVWFTVAARSAPHRRLRHHELLISTGQNYRTCNACRVGPASAADLPLRRS
jgi:hypothetical protein